jgi:hypothetical protein
MGNLLIYSAAEIFCISLPALPPKVRSNAGVPPEVYARELKRPNSFLEGDWNPDDSPLRPRRRYGW